MEKTLQKVVKEMAVLKNIMKAMKKNDNKQKEVKGNEEGRRVEMQKGVKEPKIIEMNPRKKQKYNDDSVKSREEGKEEERPRREEQRKLKVVQKKNEAKEKTLTEERRSENNENTQKNKKCDVIKKWKKQDLRARKVLAAADTAMKATTVYKEENKKVAEVARHADEGLVQARKKTGEAPVAKHQVAEVVKAKATLTMETKSKEPHAQVSFEKELSDMFGESETKKDNKGSESVVIDNKKPDPNHHQSSAAAAKK